MLDIRLDFISKIDPVNIEMMTILRRKFIDLDNEMKDFEELGCPEENVQAAMRALSIARTHLETACQYAIKSLCLIGEVKK